MAWLGGLQNIKWPLRTDSIHPTVYQEARRRILRTHGNAVSPSPWLTFADTITAPSTTWHTIDLSPGVGPNPQGIAFLNATFTYGADYGVPWVVHGRPLGTAGMIAIPMIFVSALEEITSRTFRRYVFVPVGTGGKIQLNFNDTAGAVAALGYNIDLVGWVPEDVSLNLA